MRSVGKNRRYEIEISRMRFGHTRGTLYKMGIHDTGRCEFCRQEKTCYTVLSETRD